MNQYYCHSEETGISYPETTNDLAEKPKDKPANKEILILLDYPEPQTPC